MRKKVKSFAIDEEPYENLSSKFKENYVDVTISYCLNKHIKELLQYIEMVQKGIEASSHTIPMAFVIESVARERVVRVLEPERRPGEPESSLDRELNELQGKYDAHIKRNPSATVDFSKVKLDDSPIAALLSFVGKVLLMRIRLLRDLTDDELLELAIKEGGKELLKYIRETAAPTLNKIDPELRDIVKRIRNVVQTRTDISE